MLSHCFQFFIFISFSNLYSFETNNNVRFLYLQEMVQAKDPPSHYLNKLRTYLDPKASRSHRVSFQQMKIKFKKKNYIYYLLLLLYVVVAVGL